MKLIVLQGPPASGKSTWVKKYLECLSTEDLDRYVVVSRDTIRLSTGKYWVPSREDYISILEDTAMCEALSRGLNVINDATNLNPKTIQHLKEIAEKYNAEIIFKELYVPFKEALKRDEERGKNGGLAVGKKVLEGFYKRYYTDKFNEEMYTDRRLDTMVQMRVGTESAVICDLDGTVAIHTSGRSPFDYARVEEDTALRPMVLTLRALADSGVKVFFVTGREDTDDCRERTLRWISSQVMGTRWYKLYMRNKGDHRKGDIVKEELYNQYIKGEYNIINVFDDDPKCVRMWRNIGLQCSQTYDFETVNQDKEQ